MTTSSNTSFRDADRAPARDIDREAPGASANWRGGAYAERERIASDVRSARGGRKMAHRRGGSAKAGSGADEEGRPPAGKKGAPAAKPSGRERTSGTRGRRCAVGERLADAVRSIGGAQSLSEILDTLVTCAGQEPARAGVWLIRGGGFRSWRLGRRSTGIRWTSRRRSVAPGSFRRRRRRVATAAAPNALAAQPGGDARALPIAMTGQGRGGPRPDQGTERAP